MDIGAKFEDTPSRRSWGIAVTRVRMTDVNGQTTRKHNRWCRGINIVPWTWNYSLHTDKKREKQLVLSLSSQIVFFCGFMYFTVDTIRIVSSRLLYPGRKQSWLVTSCKTADIPFEDIHFHWEVYLPNCPTVPSIYINVTNYYFEYGFNSLPEWETITDNHLDKAATALASTEMG